MGGDAEGRATAARHQPGLADRPVAQPRPSRRQPPVVLPADTRVGKISSRGSITVEGVTYKIDVDHAFTIVPVITDGDQHTLVDLDGVIIAELNRPALGVKYVGNRPTPGPAPQDARPVTEVLRHQPLPMS